MNTNANLARKGDITLPRNGRKYFQRSDKALADKPVAYTADGKRIFAFNDKGQPICFSKRPGQFDPITGEQLRCHNPMTCVNGRCKRHGGKNVTGINHYNAKTLRNANSLPGSLSVDFRQALNDPDILDLKHEIGLVDIQIVALKRSYNTFIGGTASIALMNKLKKLEYDLENNEEITEDRLHDIIDVHRRGLANLKIDEEINKRADLRRKLVETAHHRERDLHTMLRADQALALVTAVAACCKESIQTFCDNLAKKYILIPRENSQMLDKELRVLVEELKAPEIDRSHILDFSQNVVQKLGELVAKPKNFDPVAMEHPYATKQLKGTATAIKGTKIRRQLSLPEPMEVIVEES